MTSISIDKNNFKDVSSLTRDILPCFITESENGSQYSLVFKLNESDNLGQIGICEGRYNGMNRIKATSDLGFWYANKVLEDIRSGKSEITYSWSDANDYFATKYNTNLSISKNS